MRNIRTTTAKNTNTKSPEIDVKSEAVDVDPPLQFTADQRVMTGGGDITVLSYQNGNNVIIIIELNHY